MVTVDADGLVGTYRMLTGPLEHRHLEVFNLMVDLGGTVQPLPVQFFHDLDGGVTAVEVVLEPAVEPIRFLRVPDTSHLTGDVLDEMSGDYLMGPVTATVARRGLDGLVIRLAEGGFSPLVPVRDLVFRLGATGRIEFLADGRLTTAIGEFTPAGAA